MIAVRSRGIGLAVLGLTLAVLIGAFAFGVSEAAARWLVPISYAASIFVVVPHYVRAGRLVATPALILFALVALYQVPVFFNVMAVSPWDFAQLEFAFLMLGMALASIGIVLLLCDHAAAQPSVGAAVVRLQQSITLVAYVLLLIGGAWMLAAFGSPGAAADYALNTTYYEKHVYFEGRAVLGQFTMCFETAGLLAGMSAAVPREHRRVPLIVNAVPLLAMVIVSTNQGYRSPIMLALCAFLVVRSLWERSGVRVMTIALGAGGLAPVFLLWAYVRPLISSDAITDIRAIQARASIVNWWDLRDSELMTMVSNAADLVRLLNLGRWNYKLGETLFLRPFEAMIPRALWPSRPDALQIEFTKAVAPDYPDGGTISCSFILEGYVNFWLVGAVLWSAAVAWFLTRSPKLAATASERGRPWQVLLVLVGNTVMWFYIRDDFGDLVRRLGITLAVVLLGVGIVALAGALRSGAPRRAARPWTRA